MLCELKIENLALIESLRLNFETDDSSGLVVMTGETGAGKSIMLRAIHLLTGGRASADWIRNGAASCTIEALFEVNRDHRVLLDSLDEGGFTEDTTVIIKRVIGSNGRSRLYVNGSLATAKKVSELTAQMLNVASQHDHQQLLQPALHLDFLDTLGDHWPAREEVGRLYGRWQEKKAELAALREDEQDKEQKRDFLQFQVAEIRDAAFVVDEDNELADEKKRLKSADILIKLTQESYRLLSTSLLDGLVDIRKNIDQVAQLDPSAEQLAEEISSFSFQAEDHITELRHYRDSLQSDPVRLEQVSERIDELAQLKRKYGATLELVLEFAEKGEQELAVLENMDQHLEELEVEVQNLEQELLTRATALSSGRRRTAARLEEAMQEQLTSLAFYQSGFQVDWQEGDIAVDELRATGWDRVQFFFSPNPGEPARPLAKIASGGELSRLMLAMKCLLAQKDMVHTVIFDEVDAGIGGEAAEAVARKIQELASHHQVFCITHLPQIAARGTSHLRVQKNVEDGRTSSSFHHLDQAQRVQELARMLAGDSVSRQTHAWAEELLEKGKVAA